MKLLIVEDEHKIAHSLKKGLEQEMFSVDIAYDGIEGFDLTSSEQYDVIILDLMLPGINGIEICKKLRSEKNHTPILILTAKGQIEDKVNGLNSGADDYITKPFAFEEILARIKALTRRPHNNIGPILAFDNLTLNTISYEVKRKNKVIKLSNREFSLLEYFLKHPNQILKKDQIINHVWNYDTEILPNTLEVYVGYLRNKIDKSFPNEKSLIQTIRGFGYRFGEEE